MKTATTAFTRFASITAFVVASLFLAQAAYATCNNGGYCPQPTQYHCVTCATNTGNTFLNVQAQVQSNFAAIGAAKFEAGKGGEGYALSEQSGNGHSSSSLNASGGLCSGGCPTGSGSGYTLSGSAFQTVSNAAGAKTLRSGQQASTISQGTALSGVGALVQSGGQ